MVARSELGSRAPVGWRRRGGVAVAVGRASPLALQVQPLSSVTQSLSPGCWPARSCRVVLTSVEGSPAR